MERANATAPRRVLRIEASAPKLSRHDCTTAGELH
jgi:hypothetical protein